MLATSSVTSYEVGLFLHVTSVVVAFGVLFIFPLMNRMAERSDPRSLPYFYRIVTKVLRIIVTPAMVVLLVTGLYLIGEGPTGFGDPWISSTFAILIALFAIVGAALTPLSARLVALSEREVSTITNPDDLKLSNEYRAAARQLKLLSFATSLLVLAAIFLMSTKPG